MPKNTITLATAQTWAAKWQSNSQNKIKAFLIPQEDITQIFQYEGVCDIRTYIGIDETGAHKLIIVGVDAAGKDLMDDSKQQYIYDFTKPCPDFCDVTSKLYNPRP